MMKPGGFLPILRFSWTPTIAFVPFAPVERAFTLFQGTRLLKKPSLDMLDKLLGLELGFN